LAALMKIPVSRVGFTANVGADYYFGKKKR
jgi:hypothetical protein